jgi:hypothetical protein
MTEQIDQETRDMLAASLRGERVKHARTPKGFQLQWGIGPGSKSWDLEKIIFFHNGDPMVVRQRGGPAFAVMSQHVNIRFTQTAGPSKFPYDGHQLAFMTCPGTNPLAEMVGQDFKSTFPIFIVDVTGPLLTPARLSQLGQPEADAFWSEVEHQKNARYAIQNAALVTVPDDAMKRHVEDETGRGDVFVLPDYDPDPVECDGDLCGPSGGHSHSGEEVFWVHFSAAIWTAWPKHCQILQDRHHQSHSP